MLLRLVTRFSQHRTCYSILTIHVYRILFVLIVDINFFISDLIVLRIVLVCSSASMSLLFIVIPSGIIYGSKVCLRCYAKAKTCFEEILAQGYSIFLLPESESVFLSFLLSSIVNNLYPSLVRGKYSTISFFFLVSFVRAFSCCLDSSLLYFCRCAFVFHFCFVFCNM